MARIIFVTGTDTSVGKTVFTSLLLAWLAEKGASVFPLKLFCSGDRSDAEIFRSIVRNKWSLDEINPWFFAEPVTPLIAARRQQISIDLDDALQEIKHAATQCSTLLIEGAGGLMAPLGEGFNALDLITAIRAETIVVAPNKLGVLNHCMLTIRELRRSKVEKVQLALVNQPAPDPSASSNAQLLIELLQPIVPLQVPWFPPDRLKQLRENFLSSSDRGLRETFSVIMNS